eukprot:12256868-Ditylum_brightwellii.AAC.1
MIKLNNYLVNFPVLEGVTTEKISREEFIDILEDGILASMLKEFLDVCICVEEAETHKPLAKKIAHTKKEHDSDEQQRIQQVWFVKDTEKQAKKCSLSTKEVKDLNALVKDKTDEMIKERACNMHVMRYFEDLSLSSSNKSVQNIISDTSEEGS